MHGEKRTVRDKSKTGRPAGGYYKSPRWEGVLDYYVAIKKNEKGYTEKIFKIYLMCKEFAYFLKTFLQLFADSNG